MDDSDSKRDKEDIRPAMTDCLPLKVAAEAVHLKPDALRARARREARKEGNSMVAHLGGGIVAFKFGRTWRFRFPPR